MKFKEIVVLETTPACRSYVAGHLQTSECKDQVEICGFSTTNSRSPSPPECACAESVQGRANMHELNAGKAEHCPQSKGQKRVRAAVSRPDCARDITWRTSHPGWMDTG